MLGDGHRVGVPSLVLLVCALLGAAAQAAEPPLGDWITAEGNSRVRIAPCANDAATLCGRIVWLAEPLNQEGKPKVDRNNPDAGLQTRPILGLAIVTGMRPSGAGKWNGGEIYDPTVGKSYNSNMTLGAAGELVVEGCILFLCRGQSWKALPTP